MGFWVLSSAARVQVKFKTKVKTYVKSDLKISCRQNERPAEHNSVGRSFCFGPL